MSRARDATCVLREAIGIFSGRADSPPPPLLQICDRTRQCPPLFPIVAFFALSFRQWLKFPGTISSFSLLGGGLLYEIGGPVLRLVRPTGSFTLDRSRALFFPARPLGSCTFSPLSPPGCSEGFLIRRIELFFSSYYGGLVDTSLPWRYIL